MRFKIALAFSVALSGLGLPALAADAVRSPAFTGVPEEGNNFPNIAALAMGNRRSYDHKLMDVYEHPVMKLVVFGRLTPKSTLIELLPPDDGYLTDYIGLALVESTGKGQFIQIADQADKTKWDALVANKEFLLDRSSKTYDVVPLNLDNLAPENSADMIVLSRQLAPLMRDGTLEKILAGSLKALKPGGAFIVDDYRANMDKPQNPRAPNGYVRVDYAIARIETAGFKLADRDDLLLANPKDPKFVPAKNSDRFLLKFTK